MKYPIFIPSRGRSGARIAKTAEILAMENINFTFVVDPSELEQYSEAYEDGYGNPSLICPPKDNLGIGTARQTALEHAREDHCDALWQLDDDISGFRINNKKVSVKEALEYLEGRLENEKNIGVISPQFAQVIWRQKELDTVNGQCPCVATLSRTTVPINYDEELPICEDLDWMFKFIKRGYDAVMDNRIGFEVQKYGKFENKVGGVDYHEWQVAKADTILQARYPGINTRFGEKFRTSWRTVKSWRQPQN